MSPRVEHLFKGLGRFRTAFAGASTSLAAHDASEEQQQLRRSDETAPPPSHAFEGPVVIENVTPLLDGGRYPIKRIAGDVIDVEADIFREGHDALAAVLYFRERGAPRWNHMPMVFLENDRWGASFAVRSPGTYEYTIEAWPDPFGSWQHDVAKKVAAGQPISLELVEGHDLLRETLERSSDATREPIESVLAKFDAAPTDEARAALLLAEDLGAVAARAGDRSAASRYAPTLLVDVDRPLAQCSAWYELFPRSAGTEPGVHGTFADVERRLPAIAAMGFDIVYLPPIHPIGVAFRKGRNNALEAGPGDVGSPWAIGNSHGGHTAIEPALGTFDDFARLVRGARALGLEIALDYALQCSPDHPWIAEHPEWFAFRADGSIKYAENPPKKYQDIVNFNWFGPARAALWNALRDVVLFWIERGVGVFRVDNPHTKPFAFWEWMIADVRARYPDTIFLAEAFTRPKPMQYLAKSGFAQSYTYFTWRTTKAELTEYATELATGDLADGYRPNFWPNTPDILSPYLQTGGRPAFRIRLALAATLSSNYGIYSGYELAENAGLPGREEYLDSEKYEIRVRDWDAPESLAAEIAALNRIRRENAALRDWRNVEFFRADDDEVIFYGKRSGPNLLFVAVNLDPFAARDPLLWLPIGDYEVPDEAEYEVEELIGGTKHLWRGSPHRWRLDPVINPAAIFRVTFPQPPSS
jgi:starch synthase (maltosyl-transferring)